MDIFVSLRQCPVSRVNHENETWKTLTAVSTDFLSLSANPGDMMKTLPRFIEVCCRTDCCSIFYQGKSSRSGAASSNRSRRGLVAILVTAGL